MHIVGQGGIEQAIVPDRCFASGMSGFQSAHFSSDAVALSQLDEFEHAGAFIEQRIGKRGVARQHRHQPVAEGLWILKKIGLEEGQGALVNVARVRRLHHLKAEEGRALLRLVGDEQHGQGRRELLTLRIDDPRAHAGRGAAALFAHGGLTDAALPGEKMIANFFGGLPLRHSQTFSPLHPF